MLPATAAAQTPLPPLPDSTGWGVHVLTATRDPRGDLWVGTYGKGMFRLRKGTTTWERIAHDSSSTSISWDFIHAIAFGPRGQIWYGTVGNGWGVSTDGGATWKNWTFQQLGPEWQYVTPEGIVTRGDTTWVGTADGVQLTTNDGASWTALVDSTGPAAKGPADTAYAVLNNEYVRRLGLSRNGIVVTNLKGNREINNLGGVWLGRGISFASFAPRNRILVDGRLLKGTPCGLRPAQDTLPCLKRA
ncbi:MAG TPA: hypothetical protein VG817_02920, partial [Gemmatimonadales bacterium]|nr:hypothetical protein [Gemmatimonadales bacterium]